MSFEKIKKDNIPDRVFQALKQEIVNGAFRPGDKLPPESTLSTELGVSKSSVKIAIQRLVDPGPGGDQGRGRKLCAGVQPG